ncbi:hypothetical protein FKM82_031333 [Ascaphus truei]
MSYPCFSKIQNAGLETGQDCFFGSTLNLKGTYLGRGSILDSPLKVSIVLIKFYRHGLGTGATKPLYKGWAYAGAMRKEWF